MTACADRVARDYADLVAEGATAAQLCQTDRFYTLAVAFKTMLLAALLYGTFHITPITSHTVYSTVQTLVSSSVSPTLTLSNILGMFAMSSQYVIRRQVRNSHDATLDDVIDDVFDWCHILYNAVRHLTLAEANRRMDLVRMAHWLRSHRAAVNSVFRVSHGMPLDAEGRERVVQLVVQSLDAHEAGTPPQSALKSPKAGSARKSPR
jgi:hypothetical protein